jgi:hypothetical protein
MPRHTMTFLASIILATVSGTSHAQTIDNGGGTYTVNGPSGPIEVLNGSTLNINSGASVTGETPYFISSIYGDASSTINLNGGQVSGQNPYGTGLFTYGTFTSTGGTVQGPTGLVALGSVQISGGTFVGLTNTILAFGANIGIPTGGNASISGGTFEAVGSTTGDGLQIGLSTGSQGSITGGTFIGTSPARGEGDSLVYYGEHDSTMNVYGGNFSHYMNFVLDDESSFLNFFGQGFQLTSEEVAGYPDETYFLLTGTLADGDPINVQILALDTNASIVVVGSEEEVVFVGSIPEPSSVVSLATGLAGMAVAGIYRRRRLRRKPAA